MSAGLSVSAKGRYLAAPQPVETMCQAETREKCASPAGISGAGPPGRTSGPNVRPKCQAPGTDLCTRFALCNHGFAVCQEVAHPHKLENVRLVIVHVEHNFRASDEGVAGGAVHAENRVGIETRLAKLGNDVVAPLVHRAVEEDVDVFGRARRDAGEARSRQAHVSPSR